MATAIAQRRDSQVKEYTFLWEGIDGNNRNVRGETKAASEAVRALGRRAVLVASTGLSGHYFTREINDDDDRIVSAEADSENRKLLEMIGAGRCAEAMDSVAGYAAKTGADMQFKSYYWLMGAMGAAERMKGKVLGYGSIWGSGAAVVEFTPD